MSTSKKSTLHERTDIRIPRNSKIYEYLYVDTKADARAKWEKLDELKTIADINRAKWAMKIFDDFVRDMTYLYPEKKESINMLRPLVIRQILNGKSLEEGYYKMLQEL